VWQAAYFRQKWRMWRTNPHADGLLHDIVNVMQVNNDVSGTSSSHVCVMSDFRLDCPPGWWGVTGQRLWRHSILALIELPDSIHCAAYISCNYQSRRLLLGCLNLRRNFATMATDVTSRAPQGTKNAAEAALEAIGANISDKFRKAGCRAVARKLLEVATTLEPADSFADLIDHLSAQVESLRIAARQIAGNPGDAGALAAEKARADAAEARLGVVIAALGQTNAAAPVQSKAGRPPKAETTQEQAPKTRRTLSATRAVPKAGGKRRGRKPMPRNPDGSIIRSSPPAAHSNGVSDNMAYQAQPEAEAVQYQAAEHTTD
jgi:hypothetical protein